MRETFRKTQQKRSLVAESTSTEAILKSVEILQKKPSRELDVALEIIWNELTKHGANGMIDFVNNLRHLNASPTGIGNKPSEGFVAPQTVFAWIFLPFYLCHEHKPCSEHLSTKSRKCIAQSCFAPF